MSLHAASAFGYKIGEAIQALGSIPVFIPLIKSSICALVKDAIYLR
jgi:hypothetical protein